MKKLFKKILLFFGLIKIESTAPLGDSYSERSLKLLLNLNEFCKTLNNKSPQELSNQIANDINLHFYTSPSGDKKIEH